MAKHLHNYSKKRHVESINTEIEGYTVTGAKYEYYDKVTSASAKCGNEAKLAYSDAQAQTQSITETISTKLGYKLGSAKIAQISAEFGTALSISSSHSRTKTFNIETTIKAPECDEVTGAVYELVYIYDLYISKFDMLGLRHRDWDLMEEHRTHEFVTEKDVVTNHPDCQCESDTLDFRRRQRSAASKRSICIAKKSNPVGLSCKFDTYKYNGKIMGMLGYKEWAIPLPNNQTDVSGELNVSLKEIPGFLSAALMLESEQNNLTLQISAPPEALLKSFSESKPTQSSNNFKEKELNIPIMIEQLVEEQKQVITDMFALLVQFENMAFQANLLSLNAAIEAARAGEQGRNFAKSADFVYRQARKVLDTVGLYKNTLHMMQSQQETISDMNLKNIKRMEPQQIESIAVSLTALSTSLYKVSQNIKSTGGLLEHQLSNLDDYLESPLEDEQEQKVLRQTFENTKANAVEAMVTGLFEDSLNRKYEVEYLAGFENPK